MYVYTVFRSCGNLALTLQQQKSPISFNNEEKPFDSKCDEQLSLVGIGWLHLFDWIGSNEPWATSRHSLLLHLADLALSATTSTSTLGGGECTRAERRRNCNDLHIIIYFYTIFFFTLSLSHQKAFHAFYIICTITQVPAFHVVSRFQDKPWNVDVVGKKNPQHWRQLVAPPGLINHVLIYTHLHAHSIAWNARPSMKILPPSFLSLTRGFGQNMPAAAPSHVCLRT